MAAQTEAKLRLIRGAHTPTKRRPACVFTFVNVLFKPHGQAPPNDLHQQNEATVATVPEVCNKSLLQVWEGM